MKYLHDQLYSGKRLFGTWNNLGSSMASEITGLAGFDWVLIDMEHGSGDYGNLVHQIQAVSATPAAPIVRVAWNDPVAFKRVLDLGASGLMIPYVQTAEEARLAVRAMRYPPNGIRGVASLNRATGFGVEFADYVRRADTELLTIVQIETPQAVENAPAIAEVDGVDVLFVGPLDLSTGLGVQGRYDDPKYLAAVERVASAAAAAGKASGILLLNADSLGAMLELGLRFVALGSDGGLVAAGMRATAALVAKLR
jgi:4-hydroxy-2-oxoheptanedioate aldolase